MRLKRHVLVTLKGHSNFRVLEVKQEGKEIEKGGKKRGKEGDEGKIKRRVGLSFRVVVTVCRTNKTPVAPPSVREEGRRERERERERLRMPAELFTRQAGTPAALSDHSVFEQVCAVFSKAPDSSRAS